MPSIREWGGEIRAKNPNGGHTVSISLDFPPPPTAAIFKVYLGAFFVYEEPAIVDICILNHRRRLPSGIDETITYPAFDQNGSVLHIHDPTMTHVTVGMFVAWAYGRGSWNLSFWEE